MRSYSQYCSVARALDVVGDRWTLLIVRELLLQGPCRYTDLRDGLPGIATNLLADRLRELEAAGLVVREDAPPPIATTLFRLTDRGEALRPVVDELGRWGLPLMVGGPKDEAFRTHWLSFPAHLFLTDHHPDRPAVRIEIRTGDEDPMYIETAEGGVRTHRGAAEHPDLVLTGAPNTIGRLLTGNIGLAKARRLGLKSEGDTAVLDRVQPETEGSTR
jgi:DNA-binding HxlR family transcriptional regulator